MFFTGFGNADEVFPCLSKKSYQPYDFDTEQTRIHEPCDEPQLLPSVPEQLCPCSDPALFSPLKCFGMRFCTVQGQ